MVKQDSPRAEVFTEGGPRSKENGTAGLTRLWQVIPV